MTGVAFRTNLSAVAACDPLSYREAESTAAFVATAGLVGAIETVEHARQIGFSDSNSVIANGEFDAFLLPIERHFDAASGGRVLDGVIEQHANQAAYCGIVTLDHHRFPRHANL